MKNSRLKRLLTALLGRGSEKNNGDVWHKCPFCKHQRNKLSINIISEKWHCWHCNAKGRKLFVLLRKLNATKNQIEELNDILGERSFAIIDKKRDDYVSLPLEFIPLLNGNTNSPHYKNAIHYLNKRNIGPIDILRYSMGFCSSGGYSNRIIIPSYDEAGRLNYFLARDIFPNSKFKYKNPPISKDTVGFELFINWK